MNHDLVNKVEKLNTQWRFQRWVFLVFAMFFGFVAFFINTPLGAYFHEFIGLPQHIYGLLFGGLLAYIITNWHGSKSLKLLNAYCEDLHYQQRN